MSEPLPNLTNRGVELSLSWYLAGLLFIHASINSLATKALAKITSTFIFMNLGALVAICIACLATCKDFHPVRSHPLALKHTNHQLTLESRHHTSSLLLAWKTRPDGAAMDCHSFSSVCLKNPGLRQLSFRHKSGMLSVSWTMTDYDATGHISEEVKSAAIAAPAAIVRHFPIAVKPF